MKCSLVYSLVLFAMVSSEENYSTENDNLDIDAVTNDINQLQAFVDCFVDKIKCNDVTGSFKKDLGEAIQQACAKCTEPQKHILDRFLAALKEKLPEDYQTFKAKYDPEDKYFAALYPAISKA